MSLERNGSYTLSAACDGTIFWKATPIFTIHGENLNDSYEKIKGRTKKGFKCLLALHRFS
jgi:hypothetical protein